MTTYNEADKIRSQKSNLEKMRLFCLSQFEMASEGKAGGTEAAEKAQRAIQAIQGYAACITALNSYDKK